MVDALTILTLFTNVLRVGADIRFVASMKVDVICKTADKFLVDILLAFKVDTLHVVMSVYHNLNYLFQN